MTFSPRVINHSTQESRLLEITISNYSAVVLYVWKRIVLRTNTFKIFVFSRLIKILESLGHYKLVTLFKVEKHSIKKTTQQIRCSLLNKHTLPKSNFRDRIIQRSVK